MRLFLIISIIGLFSCSNKPYYVYPYYAQPVYYQYYQQPVVIYPQYYPY
jgi:hypothetical protein